MAFVDRRSELDALEREYARNQASFVVVYGRRRVGKTRLIGEFIRGKRALYYLASEESDSQNRDAFKGLVADFLGNALLRQARIDRWEDVFDVLVQAAQTGERLVIVLDEFQYLGKADPAFPSIFQRIWDASLSLCNVMVILCGSLVSLMRSQTLTYDSPLYGRRTAQIHLRQIPFRHYADFFPGKSMRELVELYSVTGGVPKYIELFEDAADVYEAIDRSVLNRDSFLYAEPNFLLQKEVAEVGTYFSAMKAMAAGSHRPSEIAAVLGVRQTSLARPLATLVELDLVRREVPVTERNPEKSKRGLYQVSDNFMRFWFRFVHPNMSYLESGHAQVARERVRANLVDGHTAYVYEDICREQVWDLAAADAWPFVPEKVGRWWAGSAEIDVVALSEGEASIVFGECKFWKGPVGANVLRELERKAEVVDWRAGARREFFVLFSIGGFTDELRELAAARNDVLLVDHSTD